MGIKNGIKLLSTIALFTIACNSALASRLPEDVWTYVKSQLPNAHQRFDSVVILNNSTMYIPLYPAQKKQVDKLSVEYTYPKVPSVKNLPEVFILNNNYVFMKAFKDNSGNFTITKNENLPEKVRLGVMPQDMLVPTGLKVPESLKVIMGDLAAPKKGDNISITTSDAVVTDENSGSSIAQINELKNTKTLFTNKKTKFVLVYDKGGTAPLYEIKLSGLPNKIAASSLTKYAIATYFGSKTGEIIDLSDEKVLAKVDFEAIPTDVDMDTTTQIAYVASAKANAIYMVDLNSAVLTKTIKSDRAPNKIAVSGKDKLLTFSDRNNENIYLMDLSSGNYAIKKIGNVKNLSSLLIGNGKVIAISRTQNKAYIYNIINFENDTPAELAQELTLSEKPTDAVIYNNKAFILCSKEGVINVYDLNQNKMLEPIGLDSTGFYSKINLIPNKSTAIVSGIGTKKVILIDLNNAKLTRKASTNIDVADIIMVDDKPKAKPVQKEGL